MDRALRIGVAALLALGGAALTAPALWAQGSGAPAPVEVSTVRQSELPGDKTFLGTVIPKRRSQVGSAVDGRVEELLVDDGDFVQKGAPMVLLRTGTIEIMVAAAEAELELREEEYKEMEAGSRPEEIERARAQLASAKALRDFRDAVFKRTEELYRTARTASLEEYEEALQAKAVADETYQEMKANLDLVVAGPRAEQKAQAKARRNMAAEEVRRLEDRLEKYTIRAPFDGYVVTKHAEVGQWIKEGDLVMEVAELNPVEVEVALPESYIAFLRTGMSARVEVSAVQNDVTTGTVSRVVPQADLRSRAFPVKIELQNEPGEAGPRLKAGMLAHVTLSVGGRPQKAMLVPKDALVLGGPMGPIVYVVEPSEGDQPPMARPVPVQLGGADEGWIKVRGDLSVGQQVVTRGNERLRPGPVRVLKTNTNSPVAPETSASTTAR